MKYKTLLPALFIAQLIPFPARGASDIINSKHNLSSTGPGEIRALVEDRICIFCHTPHNANPGTPLWNKKLEPTTYTLYDSTTLAASTQQPSGPTRLCLSCHDGTIALGDVLQPAEGIQMTMEITAGRRSYIDTDISDDHPVSFNYYDALPNPQLSTTIPAGLKTYGGGNIHCTTCHDPHDDKYGKFLIMDNSYAALCTTCHINMEGWTDSSHSSSTKTWDPPGIDKGPRSVAEYGCEICHIPHTAGAPKRLLYTLSEEDNCYPCHDGTVASANIKYQFQKFSHHPIELTTIDITANYHDPAEDPKFHQGHVECVDCHNPHATKNTAPPPSGSSQNLALVSGKKQTGTGMDVVDPITHEYELCFKCHGALTSSVPVITRWINETNTMNEFNPANPSYHPVIAQGKNTDMPSLPSLDEPDLSYTSIITCVDCHDSNDSSVLGGGNTGPRGPHGSIFRPILRQRYDTFDGFLETEDSYALCYRCHDRTKLLDDQGIYNTSGHKRHVVDQRAPCSVCHDPHGVQNIGDGSHTHLINFDVAVVSPLGLNLTPLFWDMGDRAGNCVLVCHDVEHDGGPAFSYP
ncbi:hypothetical protein KAR91_31100 [Candidatus Pacearchaeota archaeon]|nr:hypothetical protein [Candidatus Pacearchaeota archaeon]